MKKLINTLFVPFIYSLALSFWEYTGSVFTFLFSEISKTIYAKIYYKNEKTYLIQPLEDYLIFLLLCWIIVLVVLCILFVSIKNKDIKKGIFFSFVIHLIVLFFILWKS